MRKPVLVCIAFAALAALDVGIPVSMLLERAAVLAHGTEVKLSLVTQDPRSLFRGDYSILNYGIGNLANVPAPDAERQRCATAAPDCTVGRGAEVFVLLAPGEGGVHGAAQVSLTEPPAGTLFIRGKVDYGSHQTRADAKCPSGRCFTGRLRYGIEAWFGPQGVPARVDRAARTDVFALVRIDAGGKSVLSALLVNGVPVGGR